MSTSPNEIVLTPDQRQLIAKLADQTGRPWEAVLQEALVTIQQAKEPLQSGETVRDAMVRLGLLGSINDAPADLSTNPEYMDGFGER